MIREELTSVPCSEDDEETIEEKINGYAYQMAPPEPGTPAEEKLVFKADDGNGNIIGGCIVNICMWGRALLAVLWVDERFRGQGLGSMLIRKAETAARERGCYYMCLGTIDFQARPLYEKHGYRVFTVNRDVPRGHEGYSMSKRLDLHIPDYVPKNNAAEKLYAVSEGAKEDAKAIINGLDMYSDRFAPDRHDYITVSRKLVDNEGRLIAGIASGVSGWDFLDIDGIWVEEPYRGLGLGTELLRDAEKSAKEKGAYIVMTYACDWVLGFFTKNGYTIRGELEDHPKGHTAYELQKIL